MFQKNEEVDSKKQIDIWMTFGDDSEEKKILEVNAVLEIDTYDEELSKFMIKQHHALEDDIMIMMKFRVAPGRQKQAAEYLQKGMDQFSAQEQNCLNPIQKILKRPKSTGRVFFAQQEGLVIMYYNFYLESMQIQQETQKLKAFKSSQFKQDAKIYINAFIKGEQQKSLKQKTTILPNYTEITIKSSNINFFKLLNLLSAFEMIPEDISQAPFIKMVAKNIKKIKMKANLNTLRKLAKMYKEITQNSLKTLPDPYIHKNLLKNKIQITISWKPLGVAKGTIIFNHEAHIQRLVKKLSFGYLSYTP